MTLRASVSQGTAVTELGVLLMASRALNAPLPRSPAADVMEPVGGIRAGKLPCTRDVASVDVPVKASAKTKRTSRKLPVAKLEPLSANIRLLASVPLVETKLEAVRATAYNS